MAPLPGVLLLLCLLASSDASASALGGPEFLHAFYLGILRALETSPGSPALTSKFLRPLFSSHNYSLSIPQLQRSLAYMGANHRLRRFMHQLHAGKQRLRVTVMGGSISWGCCTSSRGSRDWVSLFRSWLAAAFPHADLQVVNAAVAGNPSPFANSCFDHLAGNSSDLFIIEYAANDGHAQPLSSGKKARVFERLLRKAARQPHRPAVVLLQNLVRGQLAGEKLFHDTVEDAYGVLAQYYDLPWLSVRSAIYHDLLPQRDGFLNVSDVFYQDRLHPSDLGHRFLLDILVWLFHQSALGLLLLPHSPEDTRLAGLPPPMFKDNYEEVTKLCVFDEALRDLVLEERSAGWAFVDEGSEGKKKTGYVSTAVGSSLFIKVNTSDVVLRQASGGALAAGAAGPEAAGVSITYLKSFEHMGQAVMRCASGCVCEERVANGHHTERQSQPYQMTLTPSSSEECILTVTILPETDSGEHKFKVTAVMMQERSVNPLHFDIYGGINEVLGSVGT